MLTIYLMVIGDKMPQWVEQGYAEYEKRIRGRIKLKLVEIPAVKRGRHANLARITQTEEKRLFDALPKSAYIIALDRIGKTVSTLDIAHKMEPWLQQGQPICLLVGGPEGLSNDALNMAHETWSLSALTFAHPLVRVMLAEQLYRCYSIVEGLPYHR